MSKAMSIVNAKRAVAGTPTDAVLARYASSSPATKAVLFDALVNRSEAKHERLAKSAAKRAATETGDDTSTEGEAE